MDLVRATPTGRVQSSQEVCAAPNRECFQGVSFKGRGEIKHTDGREPCPGTLRGASISEWLQLKMQIRNPFISRKGDGV